MASDRSCTRNRLMPVGVRLPTSREFTRRPCSSRCLHGSAPLLATGFRPERRSGAVSARLHRFRPARHDRPTPNRRCLVAKAHPVTAVSSTATGCLLTIRPSAARPPQRFSAAAVPLRTAHQRHVPRARRQHIPFPGLRGPRAAEPLHPSFSLSFPCPKSFSRGCC